MIVKIGDDKPEPVDFGADSHACKCGGVGVSEHSCPYKADVHSDSETQCNCCEACERECSRDV